MDFVRTMLGSALQAFAYSVISLYLCITDEMVYEMNHI